MKEVKHKLHRLCTDALLEFSPDSACLLRMHKSARNFLWEMITDEFAGIRMLMAEDAYLHCIMPGDRVDCDNVGYGVNSHYHHEDILQNW